MSDEEIIDSIFNKKPKIKVDPNLKTPSTNAAVSEAVHNITKEYPNVSIVFLYEQFKNVVNIAFRESCELTVKQYDF